MSTQSRRSKALREHGVAGTRGSEVPLPDPSCMIAEGAFYRAARRGFGGNADDALRDWLEAEAEINEMSAPLIAPASVYSRD